jgi:putative FmdB family regulatory protein
MPIYEYACNDCGHRFDIKQSWSDDSLTVCPECTGAIRRVLHPAGVIFKGSGWYITDSRNGSGLVGSSDKGSDKGEKSSDTSDKSTESTSKAEPAKKAESTAAADS